MAKDPANPGTASEDSGSGEDEVAAKLAAEQEAGGRGEFVDPTPNHAYTVAGVTAGEPTPETDEGAAADARQATRVGTTKFEHGAAAEAEAGTSSAASVDEGSSEPKLTGDDLQAKADELGIDTSTGGSRADGGMTADETREAIAAAEADAGNGAS